MSVINFLIAGVMASIRPPFCRRMGVPYLTTGNIIGSLVTRHSSLFERPIPQRVRQLRDARALSGADVMAAGGDAGEKAKLGRKAQQLAEAEAGVEMVASAGGNSWFGSERAADERRAVRAGGQSVTGGMDD